MQSLDNLCVNTTSNLNTTNLMILGKEGAGKTTIFKQFHRYFKTNYPDDTKKDMNRLMIKNDNINAVVADVNLPMTLNQICLFSVSKGDAFVLVYAVDDNDSFEYVEAIKDYLMDRKAERFPIIIIGNKNDLSERAMQFEVVDCLVSIEWEMKYLELSALDDNIVVKILETLLPQKKQKLLLPIGNDFDTNKFQGMTFRKRSNTESRLTKEKSRKTLERSMSFAKQNIILEEEEEGGMKGKNKRRYFSLPNFLIRKPSSKVTCDKKTRPKAVDNANQKVVSITWLLSCLRDNNNEHRQLETIDHDETTCIA